MTGPAVAAFWSAVHGHGKATLRDYGESRCDKWW